MPPSLRYVRCGNYVRKERYFYLSQNPFLLAWWLHWHGKPFGFGGRGIRGVFVSCLAVCRISILLLYYRFFLPSPHAVIELPVAGHLCLQVSNGYKVFDLRRKVVRKIFFSNINYQSVRSEIDRVRALGNYGFAPKIQRCNVEQRWYEEEYQNGYPLNNANWAIFSRQYQRYLAPVICDLILASSPQTVSALVYAHKQAQILRNGASLAPNEQRDTETVNTIDKFVSSLINRLQRLGDRQIHLVLSHGDLSARHVLRTNNRAVLIDWVAVNFRSALFDLYEFFFSRVRRGRRNTDMAVELAKAIADLERRLALNATAGNGGSISIASSAETYRLVYYIERVVKGRKQANQHMDAFNWYEESLVTSRGALES